jgi:hypothetical protein
VVDHNAGGDRNVTDVEAEVLVVVDVAGPNPISFGSVTKFRFPRSRAKRVSST